MSTNEGKCPYCGHSSYKEVTNVEAKISGTFKLIGAGISALSVGFFSGGAAVAARELKREADKDFSKRKFQCNWCGRTFEF